MKTSTAKDTKLKLYKHCLEYVTNHIEINRAAVSSAQSAVADETKNTAGDRYETERAMKQRETELFGKRLEESLKQEKHLQAIDVLKEYDSVQSGSLVCTSMGPFFIAISADEITIDGEEYCLVSPESPIAAAMANLKAGQTFLFRGKTVKVQSVC